jgi:hypothetical protein
MPHPHVERPTPNHVRAVFAATAAFFDLPRVATFAELADRLCSLGERHAGPLTRIDLVADPSTGGSRAQAALIRQLTAIDDEAPKVPDE